METAKGTERPNWHDLIGWSELKAFVNRKPGSWQRGAIALTGPSGIGKTTAARMLAEEYAGPMDRIYLNAARMPKVDAFRGLEDRLRLCKWASPEGHGWRVVVLDEAHKLTNAAKALFLDIIEHLPAKTLFVFTSIGGGWLDYDKGAMRRRVFEFTADGFGIGEIVLAMRNRLNGAAQGFAPDTLKTIARAAKGNLGQALQDLEMVLVTGQLPLALKRRAG